MSTNRRSVIALGGAAIGWGLSAGSVAVSATNGTPRSSGEYPKKITYATIRSSLGQLGLGIRTERGVLDVAALEKAQPRGLPVTIEDLINKRGDLGGLAAVVSTAPAQFFRAEKDVKFGPVVSSAPKVLCVGRNYRAHVAEMGPNAQPPKEPSLFNKFNSSLNHHGGTIPITQQRGSHWDYEAELVIIIGRGGKNIAKEQALSHVFGYCCGNDFTERALQQIGTMLGKSGDGWAPLGPWLVSADQIDPQNLTLKCIVNGEVRQNSNTSQMIFDCKTLISYISENWELQPGDVIFTGTCEGVIAAYPPDKQVWLKAGDKIVTAIEHLGELEFTLT